MRSWVRCLLIVFFFGRDFFRVLYSTLLHPPPLRFQCVGGVATLALTVRRSNCATGSHLVIHNSARSHPHSARSHPHSDRSHLFNCKILCLGPTPAVKKAKAATKALYMDTLERKVRLIKHNVHHGCRSGAGLNSFFARSGRGSGSFSASDPDSESTVKVSCSYKSHTVGAVFWSGSKLSFKFLQNFWKCSIYLAAPRPWIVFPVAGGRRQDRRKERRFCLQAAAQGHSQTHRPLSASHRYRSYRYRPVRVPDPHGSALVLAAGSGSALFLEVGSGSSLDRTAWSGSALKSLKACNSAVDAHNRCLELKMEPWRVYRPVVADFHHFEMKNWIRIRIKVTRIRNSAYRTVPYHFSTFYHFRCQNGLFCDTDFVCSLNSKYRKVSLTLLWTWIVGDPL